jgi:peptidoglycan/LPS O-acetylase OafA/YrhL
LKVLTESAAAVRPATSASVEGHLATLDALRGIAALSVCWFHFTNAQFAEQFGAYRASGKYGWLGVQIFFVISGFIIPLAMFRAGYRIKMLWRFMLKRVARLDPPFLVSIVIVVSGYWLSSLQPGHVVYRIPWTQLLAHLGYVNAFLGMPWLQMSYWSLAIEFQYYIFVGLCFPILALRMRLAPALILALFAALSMVAHGNQALLPHYLPLFVVGILAFRHKCLGVRTLDTLSSLLIALALVAWVDGWLQAVVALGTSLAILYVHVDTPVLKFLGSISYSLYLIHVFVGDIVFGLALPWVGQYGLLKWVLPFVAVAGAIGAAYVLYRVVELPSRRLAARISYRAPRAAELTPA